MSEYIELSVLENHTVSVKGKFYVGLAHMNCHCTIYGPMAPSASGTVKQQGSIVDVRMMINKKLKSGYTKSNFKALPKPVQDKIMDLAAQNVFGNVSVSALQVKNERIELINGAGGTPGSPASPKPRRRKVNLHVWI